MAPSQLPLVSEALKVYDLSYCVAYSLQALWFSLLPFSVIGTCPGHAVITGPPTPIWHLKAEMFYYCQ